MISKQEERFEYKGFPCVVLFQPMGFRCGYVGLPKGNKYFGKDYDFIPVDCHCGLTYSDSRLALQEDTDKWWIGFDCGHICDSHDIEKTEEYYGHEYANRIAGMFFYLHTEPVRTLDYCKKECMKIVDQLLVAEVEING